MLSLVIITQSIKQSSKPERHNATSQINLRIKFFIIIINIVISINLIVPYLQQLGR